MVINGWYTCPKCRKKLLRVLKTSTVRNTPVWCSKCKAERFPLIVDGVQLADEQVHNKQERSTPRHTVFRAVSVFFIFIHTPEQTSAGANTFPRQTSRGRSIT